MSNPLFDDLSFPFADPVAQELHVTLSRLFPTPREALSVAEQATLDTGRLYAEQAVVYLWHDILKLAGQVGKTRQLVAKAAKVIGEEHPRRAFFDDLLADRPTPVSNEPRRDDGTPVFLSGDDQVTRPEALLFHDDLTLETGRVPALIATLQELLARAPSVCMLHVNLPRTTTQGTGFRIADDLLLTNWHVLHDVRTGEPATKVVAEFDFEEDTDGSFVKSTAIPCEVDSVVTNQADDWAVIKPSEPLVDAWPIIRLADAMDPVKTASAYIVQHPNGKRKRVGFVRNQISSFDSRLLKYLTDTEPGSSGSPIFNADGALIGLHHAGGTPQEVVGRPPLIKNEGIRILRIVEGLSGRRR